MYSGGEPISAIMGIASMLSMASAGQSDNTLGGLLGALSMGAGPLLSGAGSMSAAGNLATPAAQVMGETVPNLGTGAGLSLTGGVNPISQTANTTANLGMDALAASPRAGFDKLLTSPAMTSTPSFTPQQLTGPTPSLSTGANPAAQATMEPAKAGKNGFINNIFGRKSSANQKLGLSNAVAGITDPNEKLMAGLMYMQDLKSREALQTGLVTGGAKGLIGGVGKALEDKPYTPDYRMSTVRKNRENAMNSGSKSDEIINRVRNRRKMGGLR